MKPKWIVFDVGGVLLDWERSSAALAKKFGVDHSLLLETVFSYAPKMNIGLMSPEDGWKQILIDIGMPGDPLEAIRRWRSTDFWIQDSLKLASELHAAGYKMAIFTNSWLGLEDELDKKLLPKEINLFKYIVDSSKEGLRKPDPAFYNLLEARLTDKGAAIFLIDDTGKNIPVATKMGWQTHLFDTNDSLSSANQIRSILLSENDSYSLG